MRRLVRVRRKGRGDGGGGGSASLLRRRRHGGHLWPRLESCCGCGGDRSRNQGAMVVLVGDGQCRNGHHAGERVGSGVDVLGR